MHINLSCCLFLACPTTDGDLITGLYICLHCLAMPAFSTNYARWSSELLLVLIKHIKEVNFATKVDQKRICRLTFLSILGVSDTSRGPVLVQQPDCRWKHHTPGFLLVMTLQGRGDRPTPSCSPVQRANFGSRFSLYSRGVLGFLFGSLYHLCCRKSSPKNQRQPLRA